jgi:hypothetical protein
MYDPGLLSRFDEITDELVGYKRKARVAGFNSGWNSSRNEKEQEVKDISQELVNLLGSVLAKGSFQEIKALFDIYIKSTGKSRFKHWQNCVLDYNDMYEFARQDRAAQLEVEEHFRSFMFGQICYFTKRHYLDEDMYSLKGELADKVYVALHLMRLIQGKTEDPDTDIMRDFSDRVKAGIYESILEKGLDAFKDIESLENLELPVAIEAVRNHLAVYEYDSKKLIENIQETLKSGFNAASTSMIQVAG